jgi:hypothetical protein
MPAVFQDETLVSSFQRDEDIHTATAKAVCMHRLVYVYICLCVRMDVYVRIRVNVCVRIV